MIRNYITVAIRSIWRHKGFAFINITGLAVGLASCILMLLWVADELSYDRFHADHENLFRVVEHWQQGDYESHSSLVAAPMGPAMKEELPDLLNVSRVNIEGEQMIKYGDLASESHVVAQVDPEFFEMFDFPLVSGDRSKVLSDRFSVLISQSMAAVYFGETDPVDHTLSIDGRDFVVSGMMQDVPANSHLQFDCLVPFQSRPDWLKKLTDTWRASAYYTYVQLRSDADLDRLALACDELVARHASNGETVATHSLQPITRIHLFHDVDDYLEGHGQIKYVILFAALAIVTLLLACANFMNLSTARAARRAPEVGLRKVVGARRSDLVRQFLGESLGTAAVAMVLALVLTELFLPVLNDWSGKQLSLTGLGFTTVSLTLIWLTLITGLVAGSYPALVLSGFSPLQTMQRAMRAGRYSRLFRRALVVGQFVMTVGLVIGATVLFQQLRYVQHKDLGFDRENLIYFAMRGNFTANYESIKQELLQHPAITAVTAGTPPVRDHFGSLSDPRWTGGTTESEVTWNSLAVDNDYIQALGMEIVEGQAFSGDLASEASQGFVINESARRLMGSESPIGKQFRFGRHNFDGHGMDKTEYEGTIVGVVRDFHFGSLHRSISPVLMFIDQAQARRMCVRISPGRTAEALTVLQDYWSKYSPDNRFEYHFADETINDRYSYESKLSRIVYAFTGLAVLVSCLGLFGLASFMAEDRTREIGIRKALGASIAGLVRLLCREFLWLVIVANLIVGPLAWYLMSDWLDSFAYRINLNLTPFVVAASLALLLAMVSVAWQSLKAARANPVDALKHE